MPITDIELNCTHLVSLVRFENVGHMSPRSQQHFQAACLDPTSQKILSYSFVRGRVRFPCMSVTITNEAKPSEMAAQSRSMESTSGRRDKSRNHPNSRRTLPSLDRYYLFIYQSRGVKLGNLLVKSMIYRFKHISFCYMWLYCENGFMQTPQHESISPTSHWTCGSRMISTSSVVPLITSGYRAICNDINDKNCFLVFVQRAN